MADLVVGARFGRLIVTSEPFSLRDARGYSARFVSCACDCGRDCAVSPSHLARGHRTACGSDCGLRVANYKTAEYRAWHGLKERCLNARGKDYPKYGARGIRVCARWVNSFHFFVADMGKKPTSAHSIDRINNDGNYSCGKCEECRANGWPANCRWATRSQQQRNRRKRPVFTINGVTRTQAEWAELHGMSTRTLGGRLRRGLTIEQAINEPLPRDLHRSTAKLTVEQVWLVRRSLERGLTYRALAECFGVSASTIGLIACGKNWRAA